MPSANSKGVTISFISFTLVPHVMPQALDAEIEKQRREAAEKRAEQKRQEKERMAAENKAFEVRPLGVLGT